MEEITINDLIEEYCLECNMNKMKLKNIINENKELS